MLSVVICQPHTAGHDRHGREEPTVYTVSLPRSRASREACTWWRKDRRSFHADRGLPCAQGSKGKGNTPARFRIAVRGEMLGTGLDWSLAGGLRPRGTETGLTGCRKHFGALGSQACTGITHSDRFPVPRTELEAFVLSSIPSPVLFSLSLFFKKSGSH